MKRIFKGSSKEASARPITSAAKHDVHPLLLGDRRPIERLVQRNVDKQETTQHFSPSTDPSRRLGSVYNLFLATASLLFVLAVAFGTMLGVATLVKRLEPAHRFNIYLDFHEPAVLALLFALSILWVLPPYPWRADQHRAKRHRWAGRRRERHREATAS